MAFDLTKFQPADADEFIEIALLGLQVISELLGGRIAASAPAAIAAVRAVIDSLQAAYDGKVTFDQVRQEFTKLTSGIEANDTRADAALRDKFGTQEN